MVYSITSNRTYDPCIVKEDIMDAIAYTEKLVESGIRAQFSDLSDEKGAREFAEKLGIKKFEVFGD